MEMNLFQEGFGISGHGPGIVRRLLPWGYYYLPNEHAVADEVARLVLIAIAGCSGQ